MPRSLLYTIRQGAPEGMPCLVFHDRYELLEDAEALGASLGDGVLRIAVRGPRVQTRGGSGMTRGYFWYIGPIGAPELSTLGDGLYQLELLIDETWERYGQRRMGLVGKGEGGVIALLAGLIFPDRVHSVIAIDAPLPANLADMPIEQRPLAGLPVLLAGAGTEASARALAERGARVTTTPSAPQSRLIAEILGVPA